MAYTYEQLSEITVVELRTIAEGIEHEAVHGFSTMHKEKLLPALCLALGIEARVHHVAVGINKTAIKAEIRKLKAERDTAIQKHDRTRLKEARHKIHELKRKLRKAIV
jgi:DNA-binding IclR family transcriptional regulator